MVPLTSPSRIAILAGAGLAKDAGLPSSVELAERLKTSLLQESQNTLRGSKVDYDRNRAKLLLSAFYFLDGGIRFQEGVLDRDPGFRVNIEQIGVAALELQQRLGNPLAPYASGWHRRIEELERVQPDIFSVFVDFIYSKLQEWLTIDKEASVSYLTRLGDISDLASGVDIFSLNYDLCIEKALTDFGETFINGFTIEDGWQPNLYESDTKIRLFKLHGSLDWADDRIYGVCSLEYPTHNRKEDIVNDNLRPLLIFGTAHKLSPKEPFLSLAYFFSQSILKTPILIVIGYSFGDEYVNRIVEQGLMKNPKLRMIVVSPDASELIRGQPFLDGQPRVSMIPSTAKHALNENLVRTEIAQLLKEAAQEEPFK